MKEETAVSPVKIIFTALCLFFVLYFLLTSFVVTMKVVRGHSMEPTMVPGDLIFVNKLAYGLLLPFKNDYITHWADPQPHDIILLREPEEGKLVVKRCIAVPGDPVELKEGELFIAGKKVPYNPAYNLSFHVNSGSVPRDMIFVMGDNPGKSVDSRHFGYVHISSVSGKVIQCLTHEQKRERE
jgi:signal peptidase I